jgi:hypothetical protein
VLAAGLTNLPSLIALMGGSFGTIVLGLGSSAVASPQASAMTVRIASIPPIQVRCEFSMRSLLGVKWAGWI